MILVRALFKPYGGLTSMGLFLWGCGCGLGEGGIGRALFCLSYTVFHGVSDSKMGWWDFVEISTFLRFLTICGRC